MAGRTIAQRIALVGGDEIKVQFEGLGRAGELAFTRIAAAANTGSVFSKFGASLAAVQAKMATVADGALGLARLSPTLAKPLDARARVSDSLRV
jgi:hypothetical protein